MWAKTAMEDAKQVLEILKDPKVATGRGPVNGGVEGSVSEAVTIVEKMLKKAQQAVKANTPGSGVHAGVKRKHEEVDIDHTLAPGFHLPYVGAGVQVANAVSPPEPVVASSPVVAHPRPSSSRSSRRGSTAIPPAVLNSKTSTPDPDGENRKSGKSSKSGRPNVGIRVRGGKEGPPFNKARHDHGSSSPASARPYSPASHRVTAFELTPFPESGFTAESPIYLDAPEDKDFNMTFAGNTEPRTEAMEKGPSNAQTRSREPSGADNYDVQPSPAFNPMSGSYNTFAVSPAYSNEASNRPPSSRSDQPPPFSSGYPQNAGSPYPPPGSSHGAPQQSSPPSYSPAGPTGGYNALTPHNPFPPTPETIYTSNAGSASYSHDVLHSHHMRIMNGGVDPRAMSMAPDMSAAMPQSNHGQRNMRPPSLPSDHRMGTIPVQPYSIQSAKPMHPGPQHYMDAPTPGHVASQSQSMMGTEAWTSEEGMQTATQYWNQGQNYHEMKLDNYS
ncbi:hypothetical protein GLOTRDRAFT_112307 [Gloeophyllum trabeum ATCC 11539]|uniref:Uncharacterized protein n=1 Tax=Gloeophyllum trabeum (strain ATCC 11539 / FP-39264 / Madison 617) TaxID=670483 RepID=S7PVX8_GLOTA|nr:uncharacterized protein GLOTRDRAFT_112307 [Gloeophyllum trabeum ATCC 11539]EPQ51791.1 hypothetical protein GLOTRDRAFT_112307 [Gloeophyllum trabeum ATCC 11539]